MNATAYQVITDRIIGLLEQGTIPWQKPWQGAEQAPQSLVSRKPYRGVNVFLLHAMHYTSPFWLTFKQAQELGGHVRKGEKACPVVFWKWLDVERDGEKERVPFLRYYLDPAHHEKKSFQNGLNPSSLSRILAAVGNFSWTRPQASSGFSF